LILDIFTSIDMMSDMARKRAPLVSDQIRALIRSCGVSRYEIAKQTDIDQATLSRFMAGNAGLSSKALDRLGSYLDIQVVQRSKRPVD
jgi:transcriptional regulator with XRE-family HTH domain